MASENGLITSKSIQDLSGRWMLGMAGVIGSSILLGIAGMIPFGILVTGGPLALGISIFTLAYARGDNPEFGMIFDGFKNFEKSCPVYIVRTIFIVLGFICMIVPGILLAIMYSQVFYLLADEPDLGTMEALKKSAAMMEGHKLRYIGLCMRMFGWAILCIFTLGIGYFWLAPYSAVAYANFYNDLNPGPTEFDITDHLV